MHDIYQTVISAKDVVVEFQQPSFLPFQTIVDFIVIAVNDVASRSHLLINAAAELGDEF